MPVVSGGPICGAIRVPQPQPVPHASIKTLEHQGRPDGIRTFRVDRVDGGWPARSASWQG